MINIGSTLGEESSLVLSSSGKYIVVECRLRKIKRTKKYMY